MRSAGKGLLKWKLGTWFSLRRKVIKGKIIPELQWTSDCSCRSCLLSLLVFFQMQCLVFCPFVFVLVCIFFLSIHILLLVEKVRVLCLFFNSPVLQALKDQDVKECVVGPRHVAFLLEVSYLLSSKWMVFTTAVYRMREHSKSLIWYPDLQAMAGLRCHTIPT